MPLTTGIQPEIRAGCIHVVIYDIHEKLFLRTENRLDHPQTGEENILLGYTPRQVCALMESVYGSQYVFSSPRVFRLLQKDALRMPK